MVYLDQILPTYYPHALLRKRRGYCNHLRPSVCQSFRLSACPSVCPLCYLLLNHWSKFNQIWCVSYLHEWGVQRQTFLAPPPGALGRVKRSNIIYFKLQSQFQRFLYQTLCVFSQMKDTKHIRRDLILSPGSYPRGGTLGRWGCQGGLFFKHGHVAYQIDGDDKQNRMQVKFLF